VNRTEFNARQINIGSKLKHRELQDKNAVVQLPHNSGSDNSSEMRSRKAKDIVAVS